MKILLLGNFEEVQNHEHMIKKWFEKLGHSVNTSLEGSTIEHYDLGVIIRGEHQKPSESLRNACSKLVLWNFEPPGQPYLQTEDLDKYDVIFNSSKENNDWVKLRTKTKCVWLTQAIDPEIFRPIEVPKEIDVLFIGTCTAVRFNWINQLYEQTGQKLRISIAGRGWGQKVEPVYLDALNNIINRSRVCIDLPPWSSPNYTMTDLNGLHYSQKNMMILAAGGQLLMPYNPDFEGLFKKGYKIWKYVDLEHMITLVKEILKKEELNDLWEEVHEKYTYETILKRMIEVVENG